MSKVSLGSYGAGGAQVADPALNLQLHVTRVWCQKKCQTTRTAGAPPSTPPPPPPPPPTHTHRQSHREGGGGGEREIITLVV